MYKILAKIFESRNFATYCQTQNHTIFFVLDQESTYSKIIFEENDKTFKVSNENALSIHFLPIDNTLITAQDNFHTFVEDGKAPRCDFALFTENMLCLVELKMNMTTDSEFSKSSKAEDAIKQIWNTLDFILLESQKIGQNIDTQNVIPIISMSKFPNTTKEQNKNNRYFFKWKDKFQEKFRIEIILKTEWNF